MKIADILWCHKWYSCEMMSEKHRNYILMMCNYRGPSSASNRPISSSKNPHFQNKAKSTTFLVKMSFIYMRLKNHFHIKGWALNLILIKSGGGNSEMAYWLKQIFNKQKHLYPDQGSNISLAYNFCIHFSDVISWGNHW